MGSTEYTGLVRNCFNHDKLSVSLIFVSVAVFIVMTTFNALAGSGSAPQIFNSTVGNLSDKYDTMITPAGFTFSIWGVIYLWLAVALLVIILSIFLNNSMGKLYLNPPFVTPLVSAITIINFILNLTWIFVWDREYLSVACAVLFFQQLTGNMVIGLMGRHFIVYEEQYKKGGDMFAWGIVYRIIMNGWQTYTAWCEIAFLLNLTSALVYDQNTDMRVTCLTALSLLVLIYGSWFFLENFLLDQYARWLLTPYMVVIWAVNGIRAKIEERPDLDKPPKEIEDFVLAILILASIALVAKLAIVAYRTFRERPGYSTAR